MISQYIEVLILSFIQGFSEFIPVSSSGHLIIVSEIYNFNISSLQLDISFHLGSLFAIIFYFRKDLLNLYKVLSPYPEVKKVLQNLKKKNLKLAILSNGTPNLLNELVASNNLTSLFDDLFSVEEVGIFKPDPKVYGLPLKKYKAQAFEITFLSANTWDVSGGGNYGYNSIWVNRNKSQFDKLDYKPKNEIDNLSQLLKII